MEQRIPAIVPATGCIMVSHPIVRQRLLIQVADEYAHSIPAYHACDKHHPGLWQEDLS